MKYKVHRFNIRMRRDKDKLEQFLNSLKGEVIPIVPNVTLNFQINLNQMNSKNIFE